MASLRQIKRRMKSVKNINDITKAMEMIAAFRFKKAENRFRQSHEYLKEMEKLVTNLAGSAAQLEHPFFEKRALKKKALVVMTGDKGLCGAYNTNLVKTTFEWLSKNESYETFLVPIGKVGHEFFKKKKMSLLGAYPEKGMASVGFAREITEDLKAHFLSGRADSVELLYTDYKTGGTGKPLLHPFLSLSHMMESQKDPAAANDYIFEPDFEKFFVSLLSRYIEGKIYICLLESLTSENCARMVAMKQASDNGGEVLDELKLLRNKTRQATITRELTEIVGGVNALVG